MKERIIKWFRAQRIQNKIIIIYLPLLCIPVFLLGIISYIINSEAIIDKTKKNLTDESRLITLKIDRMIADAESFSNNVMLDFNKEIKSELIESFDRDKSKSNDDYIFRRKIENKLYFSQLIFPTIESAIFIDRNYNMYATDGALIANSFRGLQSPMFIEVKKSNGKNIWFPMHKRSFWVLNSDTALITVGKKVMDTETMETLGFLFVNINERTLSSDYRSIGPDHSKGYYIVDQRGRIISSSDEKQILKPIDFNREDLLNQNDGIVDQIKRLNGEKSLLMAMPFGQSKWFLVNEINLKGLTKDARKVANIILIVGGLCIILGLLGAIVLSKTIANPIISLAHHMSKINEGNLKNPVQVKSQDEIGFLGSGLNIMLGRINDLLAKIKKEQRLKRELEFALIQDQIKPHFFYNTLDLIYVLCKTGDSEDAGRATKALADFYRVTLSKGKEVITVREEIQNLYSYLYIQSTRYSDLFNFHINISHELHEYPVPKLTLQPIVENAIYHGLKEKGSFGHISISGKVEKDIIFIFVKDDGVGISADTINGWEKGELKDDSFGLYNIDQRLKLYFGEKYGIQIESELGIGTIVTVKIPVMDGDAQQ